MGRRKERRLAAASATGRRVKLDLFAEPSGDLGGSTANVVEGDQNQNNQAGVPNSPSSSDQHQDNPLLLLGQYSDDELNEKASIGLRHAVTEASLIDQNGQVEETDHRESQNLEEIVGEGFAAQQVKQEELEKGSNLFNAFKDLDGNEIEESGIAPSGDPCNDAESAVQISEPGASVMQTGDMTSGWKMVMHEETNRYYYWNIETGETSWEVPDVLAQGAEMASENKVPLVTRETESTHTNISTSSNLNGEMDVYLSVPTLNDSKGANLISEVKENYGFGIQLENWNEEHNKENENKKVLNLSSDDIYQGELKGTVSPTTLTTGLEGRDEQPHVATEHYEAGIGIALSTRLVNYSEHLLQRLKELERSNGQPQGLEWMSKYILEIEIRLSDFKSLLAFGSSLLPFWTHSEEKLKGLERAINEEVFRYTKSGWLDKVAVSDVSLYGSDHSSLHRMGEESEVKQILFASQDPHTFPNVDTLKVQEEPHDGSTFSNVNVNHILPSGSPTEHLVNSVDESMQEVKEITHPAELISKPGPDTGEDIDMDVDMEVDDETIANHRASGDASVAKSFSPPEHVFQPNPPSVEYPSSNLEDEYGVPPPPDDEPIPPPPPDDEPVPPPPPDDPPEPPLAPPPQYSEVVQPLTYTDQCSLSYSVSGFEYYGSSITEVPSTEYYAHTEGPQISEPPPLQYYDTVSNTYSEAASVIVNPLEPLVYYNLSNGTVPPGPILSSLESSGFYVESGPVIYQDTTAADQTGALEGLPESGDSLSPNPKVESVASVICGETEMTREQIPPLSTTFQATSTIALSESVPAPSTAAAKAPPKVVRSKKRTVTVVPALRSNKKVSSLVDKWKAAKEQLHENEKDEPENAYEMLEKKRQREIEKWHAQQIASGEAKDNANFQPLGGDWRERVKRKRAKSTSEALQTAVDAPMNEKQQPDLTELSRDLPSGWQAYWDESSKEIYYGNLITSETTWSRPAK